MSYVPLPLAWVYRDGKPMPLVWCSSCNSFHIKGEHSQPRLKSV
jgi:hypothetical protein